MLINERFVRHGIEARPTAARGVRELADASRNEPGMLMTSREQAEFAAWLEAQDVKEAHRC